MSKASHSDDRPLSDLIAALIDGSITDQQFNQLDQLLKDDPIARQLYLDALQIHDDLPEVAFPSREEPSVELGSRRDETKSARASGMTLWQSGLAIAILLPIAFFIGTTLPLGSDDSVAHVPGASSNAEQTEEVGVQFADLAHARFFGEMPPKINSSPVLQRDYVLMEGMVELAFEKGASAIIEGPAVFRIETNDKLALDIGSCSVYAPAGAEGFQVETPEVNVVDRGTRFSVQVFEDNATEVQVIEGAADIYGKARTAAESVNSESSGLRLNSTDARRFSYVDPQVAVAVPFKSEQYKQYLPDRIVSYDAAMSTEGRADQLLGVEVQRGGKRYHYQVEDLIGAQVTHFHAQESHGYLIGSDQVPEDPTSFATDRSIRTGVINIGGSRQALSKSPDLSIQEGEEQFGTPGLGIRFDRPVKNGPGDDVVFFELQMFSNPLVGDAFHVSPLEFREGLHAHTVTDYDLTLESPEALQVQTLILQKFEKVPRSIAQLAAFDSTPVVQAVKFHAVAVGIDLSDLGYAKGDVVEGLFFQDALNDDDIVDPTFIAGLPEIPQ